MMPLLQQAHELSSIHCKAVKSSKLCGCFFCVSTFDPEFIEEWIDAGQTALCPQCGIDSVLPENDLCDPTDFEFLQAMKEYWFDRRFK